MAPRGPRGPRGVQGKQDEPGIPSYKERKSGHWLRAVFTVVVSTFVALMLVNVTVRESDVRGCERRQPIFRAVHVLVQRAIQSQDILKKQHSMLYDPKYKKLAEQQDKIIVSHIVQNCRKAYPPAFGLDIR